MQPGLSKLPCEFYDEAPNSAPSCQGSAFIWTAFTHAATMSLQHWFIVKGARTSFTVLKLGCVSPFSEFTAHLKKICWLQGEKWDAEPLLIEVAYTW